MVVIDVAQFEERVRPASVVDRAERSRPAISIAELCDKQYRRLPSRFALCAIH